MSSVSRGRPFRRTRRGLLLGATAMMLVLSGCAGVLSSEEAVPGTVAEVDTVLRIADRTRTSGDPAAALGLYQRAKEMSVADARPLIGMGMVYNQIGAPKDAAEAFRQALDIDPDSADALRGLGHALVALDRPEAALAHYRAAIEIRQDPRSYGGLGVALDMLGDHAAAQQAYEEGLALAPDNLALRNNLGLSRALSGDAEGAVEILRTVASDPRATARHRQNLALALGMGGRLDEAARVARLDLDEQTVKANVSYYAQLSGLSDSQQTAALFKPAEGMRTEALGMPCSGPACGYLALALAPEGLRAPTMVADAVTPVETMPLEAEPIEAPSPGAPRNLLVEKRSAPAEPVAAARPDRAAPAPAPSVAADRGTPDPADVEALRTALLDEAARDAAAAGKAAEKTDPEKTEKTPDGDAAPAAAKDAKQPPAPRLDAAVRPDGPRRADEIREAGEATGTVAGVRPAAGDAAGPARGTARARFAPEKLVARLDPGKAPAPTVRPAGTDVQDTVVRKLSRKRPKPVYGPSPIPPEFDPRITARSIGRPRLLARAPETTAPPPPAVPVASATAVEHQLAVARGVADSPPIASRPAAGTVAERRLDRPVFPPVEIERVGLGVPSLDAAGRQFPAAAADRHDAPPPDTAEGTAGKPTAAGVYEEISALDEAAGGAYALADFDDE